MSNDLLRTQLSQTRNALEAAERLRRSAEAEYRSAMAVLRHIAETLLSAEWNALKREQADVEVWPPERLGDWIAAMAERRLRRAETLAGCSLDLAAEMEALAAERDGLRGRVQELERALAEMGSRYEELQGQLAVRDAELARLRAEVVSLREPAPVPERPVAPEKKERLVPLDARPVEEQALHVIGSRGHCLRADVARALGLQGSTTGTIHRLCESLREAGWIEEEYPQAEGIVGRPPYLLRLTERGRETYRRLFGAEPAESEYDRLLARHKSVEHVLLNLQAREALLAAGAASVDLYPRPVALPGGGVFDVDIVAVFDGRSLYIEAERPTEKRARERTAKWNAYAAVTKEFYVVTPNKEAKTAIISEISLWAYRNPERAAGVTLRVCQLSAFDGEVLWQHVQKLGERREESRR